MKNYHDEISAVVNQMHAVSRLTPSQRKCLARLSEPAWPSEFAALAKLWGVCPDLVEQYLDVMISMLHEFPPTMARASATGAAEDDELRHWN
jgi:hypothetical protein